MPRMRVWRCRPAAEPGGVRAGQSRHGRETKQRESHRGRVEETNPARPSRNAADSLFSLVVEHLLCKRSIDSRACPGKKEDGLRCYEPIAGVEPATFPLQRECSTTKLNRHNEDPGNEKRLLRDALLMALDMK